MGFLLAAGALVGTFLLGMLTSVLADECEAWLLWVAERVIHSAIGRLPEHLRTRYSEEWHSHLEEVPGQISKLISALGFVWAGWRMAKMVNERPSQLPEELDSSKSGPALSIQIGDQIPEYKDEVIVSVGSGCADESYRVFIRPAGSGFEIIGYPVPSGIENAPFEPLCGFQPSVEELTELLSSRLRLPTAEVKAIRQTAIAGNVQEIGGSHSPAIRIFRRGDLERAGLTLRQSGQ